jgi:hypothetical protein
MPKTSDVTLSVSPLPGVTPVGVSLNFSVGAIPVCSVDFAPASPGPPVKISGGASGILTSPDQFKRKTPIHVSISVKSTTGPGQTTTHRLNWEGLLDGVSLSNNVGSNTYQAVLKGKAQTLLELTTMTPGLTPNSVDIYKNPYYSLIVSSDSQDDNVEKAWSSFDFSEGLDFNLSPIKFYISLIKHLLTLQQGGFDNYMGSEQDIYSEQVMSEVYNAPKYTQAIQKGLDLISQLDASAVDGGTLSSMTTCYPNASAKMKDYFFKGSNVILENLMNFLSFMGCTLVFGSNKIFVVPERSFILQEHSSPGVKSQSSRPNTAYPADYNGYSYSDNGYRDIYAVILSNKLPVGGQNLANVAYDPGTVGYYKDEHELTQASGILIVEQHPFSLFYSTNENNGRDANELKQKADQGKDTSYYDKPHEYGGNEIKENQQQRAEEKQTKYQETLSPTLKNYAQIKFYQARYGDRKGSITLSFNPNWVPGASGTLFVRETNFNLDFWVESVTHRVDMAPPAGGSAMTIVNFCCGRMGSTPVGISEDAFTGFNQGKETSFKSSFISDIGAS